MQLIDVLATKVHTAIECYHLTNKWILEPIFECLDVEEIDYKAEVIVRNFVYSAYMDITYSQANKESEVIKCTDLILRWLRKGGYIE